MTKVPVERLWDARFIKTIKALAPGTTLREGLENVLRAKMGALVVIGDTPAVLAVVDGGFTIHSDFTPAGFYELAKMDGALVLSGDGKRIIYANAQLVPDSSIATVETGTRHRTAERVAKQTGAPTIAISQRRNIITLYLGNLRYTLKDITVIRSRADQALQTLEKYRAVLERGMTALNALEFKEAATLEDVAAVLIRAEQVRRISLEIGRNIIELGIEGRLVNMQMDELGSEADEVGLLIKDYCQGTEGRNCETAAEQLAALPEENLEPGHICRILGYGVAVNVLDTSVTPRGFRVLNGISRLPPMVIDNLVAKFRTLPQICAATLTALDDVEGIGEIRAKAIRDGLKRLREKVLQERQD